jgi:hypothetical protein
MVARPIEASETVMISGEEPRSIVLEEGCFGRSSYGMVSTFSRMVGGTLASSSSIATSVSRPTGASLIVISG